MKTKPLTKTQAEELSISYALYCGCDPDDDDWEKELMGAREHIRNILTYWGTKKEKP